MASDYSVEADATPREMERVKAAVVALRKNPFAQFMANDVKAPLNFVAELPGEDNRFAQGVHINRNAKDVPPNQRGSTFIRLGTGPSETERILAHENIHALQDQDSQKFFNNSSRRNPKNVLDRGDGGLLPVRFKSSVNGEHPLDFYDAIRRMKSVGENQNEAGAYFAENIAMGKPIDHPEVKSIFDKFPTLSTLYATQNLQPHLPMPTHFKGEPEWTMLDRLKRMVGMDPPAYSPDDYAVGANSYADIIRRRK